MVTGWRKITFSRGELSGDIHVLTVIDAPSMKGVEYQRPPYPTTWARKEGKGRVWFTAMGHREDVWTNPTFQTILVGGIKWAIGEVTADVPPNLKEVAPAKVPCESQDNLTVGEDFC